MKVLLVNKYLYKKGGSEVYLFNLGSLLQKHGHIVKYFGLETGECPDTDNSIFIDAKDISSYNFLDKLAAPISLIYSKHTRKAFARAMDEFKPDIVHVNNFNFQITPSILYEAKRRKTKVVATAHDPQFVCPNHRLYIPSKSKVCEECRGGKFYNCIINKCFAGSLAKSIIGAVESTIYRLLKTYERYIDVIISPSLFLKNTLIDMGLNHNDIRVIPNFTDEGSVYNPEEAIKGDYILYFGRVSIEKGLKTLIQSINHLGQQSKTINLKIAGDGPIIKELQELINSYKNCNIELLGYKTGDELKQLIKKARFVVYPSEWYENCPMSIIEAFSLGTPAIGSNIGGIKEMINDGVDGFLFKCGDYESLSKIIEDNYFDFNKIKELSGNAYNKFSATYKSDIFFNKIEKTYMDVLKNLR